MNRYLRYICNGGAVYDDRIKLWQLTRLIVLLNLKRAHPDQIHYWNRWVARKPRT